MRLFTPCTCLKTKESYDRWIIRRFWGFRQQISKAKYLKISQNIGGKYQEALGEHCITCAKWLLSHPGRGLSENPDTSVRRSWNASSPIQLLNSGCKTSGRKWRRQRISGCNTSGVEIGDNRVQISGIRVQIGGNRVQFLPGYVVRMLPMVYPDALSRYTPCMDSKELSSISDCFGDKKAIKTPKLNTFFIRIDCKGP